MNEKGTKDSREAGPEGFLPLTPVALNVLLSLADQERHGYGIMQEVGRRTGGEVRLGPGTLYGAVKRMREGGLVEESDESPDPEIDDERRRYYRITDFGHRVAAAEVERLEALVRSARSKGIRTFPEAIPGGA